VESLFKSLFMSKLDFYRDVFPWVIIVVAYITHRRERKEQGW
jgi:hypothetical protein